MLLCSFFCANSSLKSDLLRSFCWQELTIVSMQRISATWSHPESFLFLSSFLWRSPCHLFFSHWNNFKILSQGISPGHCLVTPWFVGHGWWYFLSTMSHRLGHIQSFQLAWDIEDPVLKENNETTFSIDFIANI